MQKPFHLLLCGAVLGLSLSAHAAPTAKSLPIKFPAEKTGAKLESVARFYGPMPTGVTVSAKGRIFTNFPRWGDNVAFTVAEIKNGRPVPFPNLPINQFATNGTRAAKAVSPNAQQERATHLVSVQSVVVDAKDRLWMLDTGSIAFGPTAYGGPKLVRVDLKKNRVERTYLLPQSVALPTTYLNDIRFDLRQGQEGIAYITDSGAKSPNGIIVVDLATGASWRRLENHPSVKADPKFVPSVEGRPLYQTPPGQFPKYVGIGSDGIALSADGSRLFYCPLASRHLYSVSTAMLRNSKAASELVEGSIIDHGEKGGASDGLICDNKGRVYCTNYEQNSIVRRMPNSLFETVAHDPRILWPDTLSISRDGYLYFTANQLHRQKGYNYGKDLRKTPYSIFRVKIDAGPVLLK